MKMVETKKWYNIELGHSGANQLKMFLKQHHIYYEASECFNCLVHFEIKITSEEAYQLVNDFLERME